MNVDDFKKKFSLKDGKVVKKTKSSKFNNVKVEIDGHTFDSIKEGEFYGSLKIKKKAGLIKDFKIQVQYDIMVNNIHIAYYYLDFLIENNDGSFEYIDIKGKDSKTKKFIKTGVFALKKRLVEAIYGIKISMI
jgi:hypothetical protein